MKVIKEDGMKVPIKSWCSEIEPIALEQAKHVASLPFAFHHVSLMPDCHGGYGCPIGTVAVLENTIIPHLVGVDIGCGMRAVKTEYKVTDVNIKELWKYIWNKIPTGTEKNSIRTELISIPTRLNEFHENAEYQIGTLGGGNHFIELQSDEHGILWIMIHSGSRNLGYKVANYWNGVAKELNQKYWSSVTSELDLAFLPNGTDEFSQYIAEMEYCLEYARINREHIMSSILNYGIKAEWEYDIHHNYVRLENHFGTNVWVHRKGATSAKLDEIGIIPGSQGTSSYIVRGLGNPESFMSCSHGAGRVMSRTKAKETLSLVNEQKLMEGILHEINSIEKLDEAPSSYKNIDVVMEEQADLVEIITKLSPLAVIKG